MEDKFGKVEKVSTKQFLLSNELHFQWNSFNVREVLLLNVLHNNTTDGNNCFFFLWNSRGMWVCFCQFLSISGIDLGVKKIAAMAFFTQITMCSAWINRCQENHKNGKIRIISHFTQSPCVYALSLGICKLLGIIWYSPYRWQL